ncbi:penicillin acylase family protein [Halopseudomonas salegens]|uniref:penicillin acylase family protein n=1 Tax=Halopseudomonas salegens TaxID=1434072 RepID=UPI0012FE2EAC|nr:penicillin acylase family protein [Halopseudomonas salegens]
MKWVLAAMLLVMAVQLSLGWLLDRAAAQRSGTMTLSGLESPVQVYFDAWGIPHIEAASDLDGYRALGYLHAQDRLFQMDMLRRIGGGRLAELLGPESVETDRFFRSLGISRFARGYEQRMQAQPDEPHVQAMQAYLDGINAYIDSGARPLEYRLLLARPGYFSIRDIAHISGYMAYSFAEAFKTDALVDHIAGTLGERHLQDLVFDWPDTLPPRSRRPAQEAGDVQNESALLPLLHQVARVEQQLPAPRFLGSNAWAVNARLSQSAAPLLANDPHMGFSIPAVWYEAHLRTPEQEVYGHFLAGMPFPLLGHTRQHAWGLTMLMNDEVDFYRQQVNPDNPNQIRTEGAWQTLQVHEEVIKVRGQEDRLIRLRSSAHGPIINDNAMAQTDAQNPPPVSLLWTFLHPDNDVGKGFYGLSRARSITEFDAAAGHHWSPGLNAIYVDIDDNIAHFTLGRLKRSPQSNNSFSLLDGADSEDRFRGYRPYSDNPRNINPRSGMLWSANQPFADENPQRHLPGYYAPSERSERLRELLQVDATFDLADFKAMQMDNKRPQTLAMLHEALPLLDNRLLRSDLRAPAAEARELLEQWDGRFNHDSAAASIFQRWQEALMEALFADELGNQYAFFKQTLMAEKTLNALFWKSASPWWDNRLHPSRDGRQAAVEHAWVKTIEGLSEQLGIVPKRWAWSRLTRLEHQHALNDRLRFASLFSVDPISVNGGRETLNNMAFDLGGEHYSVKAGPSTRRLIDLADLNSTLGSNPLGQSGNPFDPHFMDQAELYNNGHYRTQLFDWQGISALPHRLLLLP